MWRKVLAVVVGILAIVVGLTAGMIANYLIVMISFSIYTPPPGTDMNDPEVLRAFIATLPVGAFLMALAAHGGGSFVSGAVCTLIVQKKWYVGATILGGLFVLAGAANLMMIPHPVWFAVVDLLLYMPLALLGCAAAGMFVGGD